MSPSTVLVTGVSRLVGGQLAARLAPDPGIGRVLGVDAVPPCRDLLRRMGREIIQQALYRYSPSAVTRSSAELSPLRGA